MIQPTEKQKNEIEIQLLTALKLLYSQRKQTDYVKDLLYRIDQRLSELK